jgi:hypothetical protein
MEMKRGAFDVIPKANDIVCNGNSRNSHDPLKLVKLSSHVEITNEDNSYHFYIIDIEFIAKGQSINQLNLSSGYNEAVT